MSNPGRLSEFPVSAADLIATAHLLLTRKPQLEKLVERKRYEATGLHAHGFTTYADAGRALARVNAVAGKLLKDALELDPTDVKCLNLLAGLYRDGGDMQAALACDQKALALQPDHAPSRQSAAESLLELGRYAEAAAAVGNLKGVPSAELQCLKLLPFAKWAERAGTVRALNQTPPFTRPIIGALDGKTLAIDHLVEQTPLYVAEARDLLVIDGYIPVRDDGSYIFEYGLDVLRGRSLLVGREAFIHRKNTQRLVVDEPCIYLTGVEWHLQNYYHALAQNYSRLAFLLDRPEYAARRVAVPESIRSWGIDFLEAMGLPRERLLLLQNRVDTVLRDVVVPIIRRVPGQEEIDALRRRLGVDRSHRGRRRLFIGRRTLASHTRLLVNEMEIADICKQHGFEEVDPAGMSIRQQIELFADAQAICGPNGAAFGNVIYAPDTASVTCLSPWETTGTWYPDLVVLCNQRFYWCFGHFLPEGLNSRLIPKVPYHIGGEDLARLLEMALEGGAPDGLAPAVAEVTEPD